MPSNACFHWIDHAASDLDGALSLGGVATTVHAFDPAYPARNGLTDDPSLVTRVNYTRNTSASPDMQIIATWASALTTHTCRVIAALNVRLPADVVQVRAEVVNYLGTSVEIAPQIYTAADLVPLDGTTDRYNLVFVLSTDRIAATARLLVRVPASTSGYYEVGRLRCGPALMLETGVDRGWSVASIDPTPVQRGPSGSVAANLLPRRRRLTASISVREYAFAIGTSGSPSTPSLMSMFADVGLSSPLFAVPRGNSLHALQRLSVFGLIEREPAVDDQGGDYYNTQVAINEIR